VAYSVFAWIALAAPTRVSPTATAEQEQHYKNYQYGFHFVTSLVKRKLDWPSKRSSDFFALGNMIEAAKADV
jgi:hypothetical protein